MWSRGMPLIILESPYRSLVEPILEYISRLQAQDPGCQITVVVPEFVPTGWLGKLLHGQAGVVLLLRLRYRPGVVVTNIPYHLKASIPHEVPAHETALREVPPPTISSAVTPLPSGADVPPSS